MSRTVGFSRRNLVAAGLGTVGLALTSRRVLALVPTPRQTAGPFYPDELPLERDNDLLHVEGKGRAKGTPLHLFGRVLTESGRAVPNVRIEIWQCDAFGRYHHPRDRGDRIDPAFQGYGQAVSATDGGYRFRTIKPVPYPGRTPHIHFALSGAGIDRLITQMYVAGEPLNERDFLLSRISDPAARESVMVDLKPAPNLDPGGLAGRFDIVLGRTLFEG